MCLSSPCPHRALSCCFASPCTNLPKCQIAPGAGKVSLSLPQLLFSLLRSAFSPSFHPLWCFAIFASRRFFPTDLKPCRLSAGINSVLCAVNSQTAAVAGAAPPCRAPLTLPAQPSLLSMNHGKNTACCARKFHLTSSHVSFTHCQVSTGPVLEVIILSVN